MSHRPIYLDYCSTTPTDKEVWKSMEPFFTEHFGNPSSSQHAYSRFAREQLDQAAWQIAKLLSVESSEIIFTSGATEAINLGIKGCFDAYKQRGKHIVSVKTEHKAVLDCLEYLEKRGAEISWLDCDENGEIDLDQLQDFIRTDTIIVCLMWGNNETGAVHPVREIGEICAEFGVLLFSDATQAIGKRMVLPKENNVTVLALSGHKFYGPKGIGALYFSSGNPRIKISPLIHGGGQQMGIRGGTVNLPGAVGLGKAAELAIIGMEGESSKLLQLKEQFQTGLKAKIKDLRVISETVNRLPHISNVSFRGVSSSELVEKMSPELAVSNASSCTAGRGRKSHVLKAMNLDREWRDGAVRFSFGKYTTADEVDRAVDIVSKWVAHLNNINSPL
ncbi:MAG: cysteine desulfurase [Saprospirales bacterium]|nr:MAG: cysteine desulfurase [Saprospirales bacterium]